MGRYIVTVTPPTPNGDLHLGHLAGPFLSADICKRILVAQGHDVLMVSYSDDYQSYLPRKAEAIDRNVADYAVLMHRAIMLSCELAGVEFDHFPATRDNCCFLNSVNHYLDCIEDDLSQVRVRIPRCPDCDKWGHEAWGRGQCDKCGASSDASQCEACGAKPDPEKMSGIRCINCGEAMVLTEQDAVVWALGRHFKAIAQRHAAHGMRESLRTYLATYLADTTDCWQITRPGDAGLPLTRFSGDPVHTWFMGLSGYRAAVQEYLDRHPERGKFVDWWAPETEMVHFLGFDCSYSHAIAYAVQLHCDKDGPRPGHFITNHFLKLDGGDFSTSRGNAVWIKDLTGLFPNDSIRLYIALHAPETAAENFSIDAYRYWHQESFLPLRRALLANPASAGKRVASAWDHHPAVLSYRRAAALDSFSPRLMAEALIELAAELPSVRSEMRIAGYQMLHELAAPLMPAIVSMSTKEEL